MDELFRYWSLATGILGVIAVLLRISFQMGGMVRRFDDHIKNSADTHKRMWDQINWLMGRRR